MSKKSVTHMCPAPGYGMTPCCGKSPLGLPVGDKLTLSPDKVTCGK